MAFYQVIILLSLSSIINGQICLTDESIYNNWKQINLDNELSVCGYSSNKVVSNGNCSMAVPKGASLIFMEGLNCNENLLFDYCKENKKVHLSSRVFFFVKKNHVTIGCYLDGNADCMDDNIRIWKSNDAIIDGKRIVFDKIKKCLNKLVSIDYVPSTTIEKVTKLPIVRTVASTSELVSPISTEKFITSSTSKPKRIFYETTQKNNVSVTTQSKQIFEISSARPSISTTVKPKQNILLSTLKSSDVSSTSTTNSLFDFDKDGFRKVSREHVVVRNDIPSTTLTTRIDLAENRVEFEFTKDIINKYNSLKASISTSSSVMIIFVIFTTIGNILIIGIVCCGLRRRSRRRSVRVNESGNFNCSCASDSYFDDGCFNKACPMKISKIGKKGIEETIEMNELKHRPELNNEMNNYNQTQSSTSISVEPASTFPKTIFNDNNHFMTAVSFHNDESIIIHDSIIGTSGLNDTQVLPQKSEIGLETAKTAIDKVVYDSSSEIEQSKLPPPNQIETVEPPSSLLNRNHDSFHDSTDGSMAVDELSEILNQIQHVAEIHIKENHCVYKNRQSTPVKNVVFNEELVVPREEFIEIPLDDIEESPPLNALKTSDKPKQDRERRKTKWNLRPRVFTPKRFQSGK